MTLLTSQCDRCGAERLRRRLTRCYTASGKIDLLCKDCCKLRQAEQQRRAEPVREVPLPPQPKRSQRTRSNFDTKWLDDLLDTPLEFPEDYIEPFRDGYPHMDG